MGSDEGKYSQAVSRVQTEIILRQMKESICKIYVDTELASGFFCKIPFGDKKIYSLITNYHLINEAYFKTHNEIILTLDEDKTRISIKNCDTRTKYYSEKYDTTIIVIKNTEAIKNLFLEIDEDIFKKDKDCFKNSTIYNISYPKGSKTMVSYGLIKEIDGYEIEHFCCTEKGSSGSPIFNLSNNKVIGIDIGGKKNKDEPFNIGHYLKRPINEFIEEVKNKNDFSFVYDESNQAQQFNKNYEKQISSEFPKMSITNDDFNNDNPLRKNLSSDINYNVGDSITCEKLQRQISLKESSGVGCTLIKKNEITLKLNINKSQFGQKIYFLSKHHDIDEFVNKNNTKIIINGKEKNFEKYVTAKEENYKIVMQFSEKLKYCSKMFLDCMNIIDIDLSSFDTEEVVKMAYMFANCINLVNIKLSFIKTENVVDMSNMFYNCVNLQYLDLSSFNISSLINMHEMFANCKKLSTIVLSPSFNTKSVSDMNFIFYGCNSIKFISLEKTTNEKLIFEYKNKINNK